MWAVDGKFDRKFKSGLTLAHTHQLAHIIWTPLQETSSCSE